MYEGVVNSPATTITNDINSTDTIIYLLDPTNVPAELPNLMVLGTGANAETVRVLSIDGSSIEVERGFQGTARAWNSGTVIARNFTEYDYSALKENIEELEETKETPAGAQAKASAALAAAADYTDQEVDVVNSALGVHLAENTTKIIIATRDLSITGIQEIELGIIPKGLIIHCNVDLAAFKSAIAYVDKMGNVSTLSDYAQQPGLKIITDKLSFYNSGGDTTIGSISISGTKLVINWTKTGTGATGTIGIIVMAFNHGE